MIFIYIGIIFIIYFFFLNLYKNRNKYFLKKALLFVLFLLIFRINHIFIFLSIIIYIIFLVLKTKEPINNLSSSESDYISRSEAFSILGLSQNASKEEIKSTYRKLMHKIHPDKGGNSYLANQVTNAYKTLMK